MTNNVQIYYGDGKGKTTSAIGQCIKAAGEGKQVIIVQFLKGKDSLELEFIKRLEPEIKLFRFEKSNKCYCDLSEEEKAEQDSNIRNGLNYIKKVLTTGECDVLVIDEMLGLVDNHIISVEDVIQILRQKDEGVELILTGRVLPKELESYAEDIYQINTIKEANRS